MATVEANTIKLAREIHDHCQQLEQTNLNDDQKLLLKNIDDVAFKIYTMPKLIISGEPDGS